MKVTVKQLADLVRGQVYGDGGLIVSAARPLGEAAAGEITYLDGEKHLARFQSSPAVAAVAPPSVPLNGKTLIRVDDPLTAFVAIVKHLHGRPELPHCGIDARAHVDPSATFGAEPSVHPFACVGAGTTVGDRCRIHSGVAIGRDCRIGNDVTIYPNAVLYDGTCVGDRAIIHANAVLGADGFGYRFQDGRHVKIPQQGRVEIGADVEIGACTTIDRGTFGATVIGTGSKIDNLVQVGHNCQVGKHNIFVSQLGMAGSCSTGDYVVIAGQVGVADHVHIGAGAVIGAKAGVVKDIPDGQRTLGAPATPEREQKRILMSLERLPEIRKDLRKIKQQLGMKDEDYGLNRQFTIGNSPIGLLAGWGRFPIVFAEKARSLNIPVVCVGVRHEASSELASLARRFYWTGLAKIGRTIRCFRKEGVRQVVMAGKIHKTNLFVPWRIVRLLPDWRTIRFWWRRSRRDNRDDTLLLSLIDEFAADGIQFTSALDICPELLVQAGLLTRRAPTHREEEDIHFGWEMAKEMGRLDVGQSVAVKEKAVLAVEAIEGTDKAIARAGELCRAGNFVVVKVAKPRQDMRFDVPTIGVSTIETMARTRGRVLAIEAGKTIVIDEKETVALADHYGISIVAR